MSIAGLYTNAMRRTWPRAPSDMTKAAAGPSSTAATPCPAWLSLSTISTTAEQAVAKLRQAADDGYYQKEPLGRAFAQGKLADALSIQAEI